MTEPTRRPDDANREPRDDVRDTVADTSEATPSTETERRTAKAAGPPAGAAAGAVAGAAAGLAVGAFGPVGAMVGAIVGALGGTAAGAAGAQGADDDLYTAQDDAYYHSLWEARLDRAADQRFDRARAAYQFGHIAARHPDFAATHFADVEPKLRQRWPNELRSQAGEWDAVRSYVEEGYSHARSRGAGERRDPSIIGSAGSAVDPVELDRARAGLPSTPDPRG